MAAKQQTGLSEKGVLLKHLSDGLKYDEIARIYGISVHTVRWWVSRHKLHQKPDGAYVEEVNILRELKVEKMNQYNLLSRSWKYEKIG